MNRSILIIEDDIETQFLFSEILQAEGYGVITKSNGSDALTYLNSNPLPDLVFMDLNFPGGTPEDFTNGLRTLVGGEKVPVIIVSGKSDIAEYSQKLKALTFLKKPFEIDPLLTMIDHVFKSGSSVENSTR